MGTSCVAYLVIVGLVTAGQAYVQGKSKHLLSQLQTFKVVHRSFMF